MDRREQAETCINNLMNGVERSLSLKNRDKFTQNIATFRRDINECLKSSSTNGTNKKADKWINHYLTRYLIGK